MIYLVCGKLTFHSNCEKNQFKTPQIIGGDRKNEKRGHLRFFGDGQHPENSPSLCRRVFQPWRKLQNTYSRKGRDFTLSPAAGL